MVIVLAMAAASPGFSTEVADRVVPVGVAVMKVGRLALTAVRVRMTPVAFNGTPPAPVTCRVIDELAGTLAIVGTPRGSRVSRMRAGSIVTTVEGADGAAVSAVCTPNAVATSPATTATWSVLRRRLMRRPFGWMSAMDVVPSEGVTRS